MEIQYKISELNLGIYFQIVLKKLSIYRTYEQVKTEEFERISAFRPLPKLELESIKEDEPVPEPTIETFEIDNNLTLDGFNSLLNGFRVERGLDVIAETVNNDRVSDTDEPTGSSPTAGEVEQAQTEQPAPNTDTDLDIDEEDFDEEDVDLDDEGSVEDLSENTAEQTTHLETSDDDDEVTLEDGIVSDSDYVPEMEAPTDSGLTYRTFSAVDFNIEDENEESDDVIVEVDADDEGVALDIDDENEEVVLDIDESSDEDSEIVLEIEEDSNDDDESGSYEISYEDDTSDTNNSNEELQVDDDDAELEPDEDGVMVDEDELDLDEDDWTDDEGDYTPEAPTSTSYQLSEKPPLETLTATLTSVSSEQTQTSAEYTVGVIVAEVFNPNYTPFTHPKPQLRVSQKAEAPKVTPTQQVKTPPVAPQTKPTPDEEDLQLKPPREGEDFILYIRRLMRVEEHLAYHHFPKSEVMSALNAGKCVKKRGMIIFNHA